MKKLLIKLFIPDAETLAGFAAEAVQKLVNESGKADVIGRYGSMADSATDVQKWITSTLVDGRVDDAEKAAIAVKLTPLFKTIREAL